MSDYYEAAATWVACDPDGGDGEWVGATEEHLWETDHILHEDPVEEARRLWRCSRDKFVETGYGYYAWQMVEIEKSVLKYTVAA